MADSVAADPKPQAKSREPMPFGARRLSVEQIVGFLALFLLAIGCFFVLRPFISAILWAIILVFSTWPAFRRLQAWLGGRWTLAAGVMTLLIAIMLLLPLIMIGTSLAETGQTLLEAIRETIRAGLPALPGWVLGIPIVGPAFSDIWSEISVNTSAVVDLVQPYFGALRDVAVASGIAVGSGILEISLSLLITFFLFRDGGKGAERATRLIERVVGGRARSLVQIAFGTIEGVVHGLIGTALVQGVLAGIGFFIAGIPSAMVLGFLCFVLSLFPVGAPLVWIPATIWLFQQGELGWAIFMGLWGGLIVSSVDNFLKPYLISRGTRMPFLLIFMGVVGGALTFGFIGIFIGPTLLAVGYALIKEWSATAPAETGNAQPEQRQSDAII